MARDVKRDALEARQLLDNEFLAFMLDGLRADAINRVAYAPASAHDERHAGAAAIRVIDDFRQGLLQAVRAGEAPERPKRGAPA